MTRTFKLSLISILLLSSVFAQLDPSSNPEFGHHEEQSFEPEIMDVEEEHLPEGGRALLGYPKLRLVADYEHVTAGTEEFKTYVKTQLIPSILSYLNNALSVKSPVMSLIQSSAETLCGFPTPQALQKGVKADIVAIVYSKEDKTGGWMAATTSCMMSSSKKPLIFKIGINTHAIGAASVDTPLTNDLYTTTLIHEFIHGLGMNGILYKYFVDKNGKTLTDHVKKITIAGAEKTVIDLEPLTTRLRNFYGCKTVPGLIMEDDGGAHLERRYFQSETMSSGGIHGSKTSEISFGFLEGTGWYIPDYSYAEPYFFGKGQGCDFIFGSCDANVFDEYCDSTARDCTQVGNSGGYCKSDSKSDSCKVYKPQTEFNCEYPSAIYYTSLASMQTIGRGLGSKCFSGNLTSKKTGDVKQTTYCFTYNCVGSGSKTTLEVNFGTTTVTCKKQGPTTVTGYRGAINCPDPLTFCSTIGKPTCSRNCLGRGKCVNGKCQCNKGFQGTDCAFTA